MPGLPGPTQPSCSPHPTPCSCPPPSSLRLCLQNTKLTAPHPGQGACQLQWEGWWKTALEMLTGLGGTSHIDFLKEINPEYSLEGLMLKLKLEYFGHLIPRTDSQEKTLMLGKIEGGRRRG